MHVLGGSNIIYITIPPIEMESCNKIHGDEVVVVSGAATTQAWAQTAVGGTIGEIHDADDSSAMEAVGELGKKQIRSIAMSSNRYRFFPKGMKSTFPRH